MAKKAASTPVQAKSSPAKAAPKYANGKPAAAKPAAPKAAKPAASKSVAPALTSELIGIAAGEVWQTLADNGPQGVASLKKAIDQPTDFVIAALGWLAREDKLQFDAAGKSATVSLK